MANEIYAGSDFNAQMGDDDMSGYTVESIGATLPHPHLKAKRPMSGRRLPLGVSSTGTVAATIQAIITTRPQILWRLERFIVPSDIAALFTIDDILVGVASVFAATGPIPARAFDEQATSILLGTDTNQPATDLTTKVTNISGAPQQFRACYIGIAVV